MSRIETQVQQMITRCVDSIWFWLDEGMAFSDAAAKVKSETVLGATPWAEVIDRASDVLA